MLDNNAYCSFIFNRNKLDYLECYFRFNAYLQINIVVINYIQFYL